MSDIDDPAGDRAYPPVPTAGSVSKALPGLVRIGVGAGIRTAGWSARAYLRAGNRVVHAAVSGESAAELLHDVERSVKGYARDVLGIPAIEERLPGPIRERRPVPQPAADPAPDLKKIAADDARSLQQKGADLLHKSTDVRYEEAAHPAYERIIDEIAPDEARILRYLTVEGPQPSVDVRQGKTPLINSPLIGTNMVAPGLSMIGPNSGVRYSERVPAYLNNLFRLGLIWFSREPLADPLRYQVLEAQPDVLEALHGPGKTKTVRRSILLTPFGEDFCRVCLPGVAAAAPLRASGVHANGNAG
ncbi:hypothetical protein DSM112329_01365 [Paraconexibacter sp. AEG42_29]|uniref:DUF4393 domain-containing protein n=1 Tax=Paraconexibacter sp. AEG42_29 TaxID=2997339 RepID=A0AAU7ASB3_9ACTN